MSEERDKRTEEAEYRMKGRLGEAGQQHGPRQMGQTFPAPCQRVTQHTVAPTRLEDCTKNKAARTQKKLAGSAKGLSC